MFLGVEGPDMLRFCDTDIFKMSPVNGKKTFTEISSSSADACRFPSRVGIEVVRSKPPARIPPPISLGTIFTFLKVPRRALKIAVSDGRR